QRVVLLLPDGPEFVSSFWGALKIGAVPVPTNTLLKARDYEYILKDSRATVVIAGESLVAAVEEVHPRLPDLTHVVVVGRPAAGQLAYGELVEAERPELAPAATTRDDVAFWQYTSGTTGTPKAAVHLHHDMLVCCEAFGRHVLEIGPEDRTFSVAKLFFAYGLGNALYFPFHVGAATVLSPGRPEPARVFETITRERPTLFFAVPTAFAALLQVAGAERTYDLSSVRLCLSAGEPLPKALYERWRERFGLEILDGIGSTEMCHTFIGNRRGRVRPGSSGKLVPGYDARVVDDDGGDAAAGGGGRGGRRRPGRARESARVRCAGARSRAGPGAGRRAEGVREAAPRAVQVPALDRVRPRAAENGNGQDSKIQVAGDSGRVHSTS